jgi:hypothetical protein
MEEEKQQSRIDSPCSSSLLSCTLSDSVTSDAVWAEIELAERYMVSAMFEEAATTAAATLQTLINETHTKDMTGLCAPIEERDDLEREGEEALQEVGTSEREAMLESAGMVLLQAYHALGRSVKSNYLNYTQLMASNSTCKLDLMKIMKLGFQARRSFTCQGCCAQRPVLLQSCCVRMCVTSHFPFCDCCRVGEYFSSLRILNAQISEFPPSVLVAG